MTQEHINIGSAERAGDGESLRSAFAKIESNFIELYARQSTADGNTLSLDLIGNVLGDDSTVMVDSSNNTIIATGGITGNVTGQVSDLSNHSLSALSNVSDTVPNTGQVLKWNGSEWEAGFDAGTGGSGGAITVAHHLRPKPETKSPRRCRPRERPSPIPTDPQIHTPVRLATTPAP